jgi:DNA-binding GntR family transcriptional regulator
VNHEPDALELLAPAESQGLADTVTEQIRAIILAGRLEPGERLREKQLAGALEVSRGPIRDALLQLEREGLVVRRRNRGAVVAHLSRGDLDEVFSLRLAIEPFVSVWAARNSTEEHWAEMAECIGTFARLDTLVTVSEAAEIDLRFHDVVYRASGHTRVARLWQDLRSQVYFFMLARTYVQEPDFASIMVRGHQELLDAIRDRNEELVREAAVAHVQTSYARVIAGYDHDGALPGA